MKERNEAPATLRRSTIHRFKIDYNEEDALEMHKIPKWQKV